MQKCIVKNLKETKTLAKKFAKTLKGGEVVLLKGDLGVGKTTFTQAVFNALGVKENVTSPTFTLLKEYSVKDLNLYHFDMYRIENENEATEIGINEYLNQSNAICVIEWYEKIIGLIPDKNIVIKIMNLGGSLRQFEFEYN